MSTIRDLVTYLETIAPLENQEVYDNAGLLVGNHATTITNVLISLDTTEEVINEAVKRGCNLVVAHHPIIFNGLKRLNGYHYVERAVIQAIKHDVAIYAIHTNLDNVWQNGVNGKIASRLGLVKTGPLRAKDLKGADFGSGLIGTLPAKMSFDEFGRHLISAMELPGFRRTKIISDHVKKVAICGGAGRFLLVDAIAAGAQVFISSDFKYHEYFDANDQITIIDIGHYESEKFTIDLLHQLITGKFSKFAAYCTKVNTNPLTYNYKNGHN